MPEIQIQDVERMREALSWLGDQVIAFATSSGWLPVAGSQAATEGSSFVRPESVCTAQNLASFLITVSADHLLCFTKALAEPNVAVGSWTCVRSLLESAALAAWLIDPSIDVRTRVQRGLALRYEGLDQQAKCARAGGLVSVPAVQSRIDAVERDAVDMGFAPVVTRDGKRIGIGQIMPPITELIRVTLDEEVAYRRLSAVAHGHFWAISQLAFRPAPDHGPNVSSGGVRLSYLEKSAYMAGQAYLVLVASRALTRPVWYQCVYYGWDVDHLRVILESAFDRVRIAPDLRFWRLSR